MVRRRFVEVTHHRVGHGAAPYFHDVESGIFVIGEQGVDVLLFQTGGKERLLTVAQCQIPDFKLLLHCF